MLSDTVSDNDLALISLLFFWSPEKMADWVKQAFRFRHLDSSEIERLIVINAWCPDKLYRTGTNKNPNLVVESLGDIFIINLTLTEQGVFKLDSVKWMKRK
jgi:hypothetical protein